MVEAVTFDATGTLFHCPTLARLYAEAFDRHGTDVSQAQVETLFPIAWKELDCAVARGGDRFADHPQGATGFWQDLLARICALAGAPDPSPFLAADLYQVFARGSSWRVFSEVASALTDLHSAGFRLGVISNWDQRLGPLLRELELDHFFETVVVSGEVGHAKPDRRIFDHALEQLKLAPVQVLHVGDGRINDFEGATAAGLQAFLIDRRQGKNLRSAAQRARGGRL